MELSQLGCFDAARFINAKPCWRQDHGPAAAWTAIAKPERRPMRWFADGRSGSLSGAGNASPS